MLVNALQQSQSDPDCLNLVDDSQTGRSFLLSTFENNTVHLFSAKANNTRDQPASLKRALHPYSLSALHLGYGHQLNKRFCNVFLKDNNIVYIDQNGAVTARKADKDASAMSENISMNVLNGNPVESNNIQLADDNRNIRPRINSDY